MKDFRLETILCMEVICGRKEIPEERRSEILKMQVELQKQICRDLRVPETPGCLSQVPNGVVLSSAASDVLEKLARTLATI